MKVWNFQFDGTREAEIFELLEEKVDKIRSKVGSTADVLGMLDDINIDDLLMRSVQNNEPPGATAEEFESLVEEREQTLLQWYERSLIDPSTFDDESRQRIREVMDESADVFGSEADIRRFIEDGLAAFGGSIRKTGDRLYELSVPDQLSNTGQLTTREPITFNREFAMDQGGIEYLSPDDPLVQRLRDRILGDRNEGRVGLKLLSFLDEPGIVFVFRVGFEDGTGELIHEELVPVFIDRANRNPRRPLAETVLERETVTAMPDGTTVRQLLEERETLETAAEQYVGNVITGLHSDLREARQEDIEVERADLDVYAEAERERIETFIEQYRTQADEGRDMDISIRNQRRRLEQLESRVAERKTELERRGQVISVAPEIEAWCIALPVK